MGDGCSDEESSLPRRLDGRAYSIVNAENAGTADGRGLLGWYYPDEWDAFLQSTVTRKDLEKSIPAPQAGRISFLTLTNHFYSLATPLPQGKGMYPTLMSIPDVVGFDLYPLQVWCRPAFGDVMDAQRELGSTSGGKPTFQWIEAAPMEHECKDHKQLDPTPADRARRDLARSGGRRRRDRLLPEPLVDDDRDRDRTHQPRDQVARARRCSPPSRPASSDASGVRVSARTLNGATYVIAVNTTEHEPSRRRSRSTASRGRSPVIVGGGQVVGCGRHRLRRQLRPPRRPRLHHSARRLVADPSESFAFARELGTPLRGERPRAKPAGSFGPEVGGALNRVGTGAEASAPHVAAAKPLPA